MLVKSVPNINKPSKTRQFVGEEIQLAGGHVKKDLASLIMKEMFIKPIISYRFFHQTNNILKDLKYPVLSMLFEGV